jgi:hypothetical protein
VDIYEIRVAGHLSRRMAQAFGCGGLRLLPDGSSMLTFAAADQAALYGLLTRLRDAGLELLAAQRVPAPTEPRLDPAAVPAAEEASDVVVD